MRKLLGLIMAAAGLLGATGCTSLGYYAQAAQGQLRLLAARQSIAGLLAAADTDPVLAQRLRTVHAALAFAEAELALAPGGRYRSYVATGRDYVVWNVFAAPQLDVEPLTWCFPIAGCVAYRGYFARDDAEAFARGLQRDGYDTWVGGVDAYSTLGWFDDPVLDTFIARPPAGLVGLLFHELAHSRVYLPGDTAFNESYATVVELAGLERWFARQPGAAAGVEYQQQRARMALRQRFSTFVLQAREQLAARYRAAGAGADAASVRAAAFAQLQADYLAQREQLGGGVYDGWFDTPNNARLVPFAAYWTYVPALTRLLELSGSLAAFHSAVAELAGLDASQRAARLAELAPAADSSGATVTPDAAGGASGEYPASVRPGIRPASGR